MLRSVKYQMEIIYMFVIFFLIATFVEVSYREYLLDVIHKKNPAGSEALFDIVLDLKLRKKFGHFFSFFFRKGRVY